MYCGDETGSFIGEIGSSISRFGYGGNDCPTYVIPSYVASTINRNTNATTTTTTTDNNNDDDDDIGTNDYRMRMMKKKKRYYYYSPSSSSLSSSKKNNNSNYCIPTTCYHPKWSDPEYCTSFSTPLRTVPLVSSSNSSAYSSSSLYSSANSNEHHNLHNSIENRRNYNRNNDNININNNNNNNKCEPILDPDMYLMQGDCIHDWDSYMYLWESAIDAMHVSDPYKHTTGGSGSNPGSNGSRTTASSGITSSLLTTSGSTSSSNSNDNRCIHPLLAITPGYTYRVNSTGSSTTSSMNTTGSNYSSNNNNKNNNNDLSSSTIAATTKTYGEAEQQNNINNNNNNNSNSSTNMNSNNNNNNNTNANANDNDNNIHYNNENENESVQKQHRKELIQLTELFMEQLNCTNGLFIAPSPMLSSFGHGRQTSLIVDINNNGCCVTPIVDGIVLKCSQRRNGRGSDYISNVLWYTIEKQLQYKNNNNNNKRQSQSQNRQGIYNNSMLQSSSTTGRLLRPRYEVASQRYYSNKANTTMMTRASTNNSNGGGVSSSNQNQNQNQYLHHNNNLLLFDRWAMLDLMYELRTSSDRYIQLSTDRSGTFRPLFDTSSTSTTTTTTTTTTVLSPSSTTMMSDQKKPMLYELPDGTILDLSPQSSLSATSSSSQSSDATMNIGTTMNNTWMDEQQYNDWNADICRIPELLFTDTVPFVSNQHEDDNITRFVHQHPTLSNLPLHKLIHSSLSSIGDVDVRRELSNCIVLVGEMSMMLQNNTYNTTTTGGTSASTSNSTNNNTNSSNTNFNNNYNTLEQRLSYELTNSTNRIIPSSYKCKIHSSKDSIERQCSAWIGGSIMTSLGSFQQLWLSKAEYEEYGAALAIQRFP